MSNAIPGGWSTYNCDISEEATKAFYEAFKGFKGKSQGNRIKRIEEKMGK